MVVEVGDVNTAAAESGVEIMGGLNRPRLPPFQPLVMDPSAQIESRIRR